MAKRFNIEDYIGKEFKYGLYVVGLDEDYIKLHSQSNKWIFRCSCGNLFSCQPGKISCGMKKSCGCKIIEEKNKLTKHNMAYNRFYHSWVAIIQRCYNKKDSHYKRYGARGIYVCYEWRDSPIEFIKWAESTHPGENGYSIDRIDNNGPYSPENCKWSTAKEQSRNRRTNKMIEIDGVSKSLAEWCDIYKTKYSSVLARIQNGWDEKEALETPIGKVGTNNRKTIPNSTQDS